MTGVGAAYLVTRKVRDFKGARVVTVTPGALLAMLEAGGGQSAD